MNQDLLEDKKRAVIEQFGPWTAHNIRLDDDRYTIDRRIVGDEIKLRRIVQIVSDLSGAALTDLRVLDLACLEGLYAIELARHGATVLGIEGREANIQKARYVKEALSLSNLTLIRDDVRNLSVAEHGYFDVVMCLGILYHLDAPDVFLFLEKIAEVCRQVLIVDTHISLQPHKSHIHKGKEYWGRQAFEHDEDSTPLERIQHLWKSLDNLNSFWFTRASLYNVLAEVGFTSVYECHNPPEVEKPRDRVTLVAIKGRRQKLISSPLMHETPDQIWPETNGDPDQTITNTQETHV
jgi:SAM-dependent methyltransferase